MSIQRASVRLGCGKPPQSSSSTPAKAAKPEKAAPASKPEKAEKKGADSTESPKASGDKKSGE